LQSRLADVDHQVSYEFADFLIMHLEIWDEKTYVELQDDLVEVLKNQAIWVVLILLNFSIFN
jgi:hypothetical protein